MAVLEAVRTGAARAPTDGMTTGNSATELTAATPLVAPTPRRVLMKGNEAIAEAAIQAGCDAYFGYPITPQAELLEWMARRMPEEGRVFVQAESELGAINMALGAAATGARVLVSSSSPGHQPDGRGHELHGRLGAARRARQRDAWRSGPRQHRAVAVRLLPGGQGPRPRRLPRPGPRARIDQRGDGPRPPTRSRSPSATGRR